MLVGIKSAFELRERVVKQLQDEDCEHDDPSLLEDLAAYLNASAEQLPLLDPSGSTLRMQELEEEIVRCTVHRAKDDKSEAARMLGIGRNTLYRILRRSGWKPDIMRGQR